MGRRERRRVETRRELLAAGRRLFGHKGLYESRIEDLSSLAGIAKGTLYGYFRNKEELVEAVVTEAFDLLRAEVDRRAAGIRSRRGVLTCVAEAHFDFFRQNPDLMRVLHQVRGLLKFRRPEAARLRRVLARHLDHLAGLLASTGGTRPRAGTEIAILLFGAVSGIASTRAAVKGPVNPPSGTGATARALAALVLEFERRPRASHPGRPAGPRRRRRPTE